MATQVLKQYIDKVLGNSIRCLLPSYWWKRLFGMVVDEVDKVKNSISTLEDGYKALEESKADADAFIMLETTELDRMEYGAVYLVHGQQDSLKVNFWEYKSPRPDVLNWTIWFSNKTSLEVTANGSAFQWEGGTPTINLNNLNPNNLYRLDCTLVTVGASGALIKFVRRVARIVEYGNSDKYDTFVSETSTNAVQNKVVTNALNNKVDKVEGKQLSTEDFTTTLKNKLEGLSNYDDTELSEAVARLRDDFNSLTQEDISAAIENFNEIISFLDGIEDSESLDSIIASIEQQIANKQDKIEDIETIRSGAALGATALQEHQDISHLATKEEVTNLQNEVIANEEVSAAAFNDINERIEQLSENVSGAAATKEELAEAVTTLNGSIATKQDTLVSGTNIKTLNGESILGEGNIVLNVDTSSLATKEELESLTNEVITNEEVSAAAFNEINDRINAISENVSGTTVTKEEFESTVTTLNESITTKADATATNEAITGLQTSVNGIGESLANYATTEALNTKITNITNEILTNEEITATALTNLDARIKEIIARLDALEG